MLKKWKKSLKFFSTIIFLLVYITADRYSRETIRSERNKKPLSGSTGSFNAVVSEDKFSEATVKTVVGYSREFKLKQEMEDRIDCLATNIESDSSDDNQWKRDRKLGINLFSAYYDRRQHPYNYVRIIGLLPRNLTLYCQIWYKRANDTLAHVTRKAVIREIWSKSWDRGSRQCLADDYPSLISCLAPYENGSQTLPPPFGVSFTDKSCTGDGKTFLKIHFDPPPRSSPRFKIKNFLICVKPLHFTNVDSKTLREWLEINHRLGAEKVVVYAPETTRIDSSTFGKSGRIVDVKKFQAPKDQNCPARNFEESIWQKRKMEIIAYNDCFYSNLDQSVFVIPLDVDEIIVPKIGNNWFEAFSAHFRTPEDGSHRTFSPTFKNYASFSVRNAYFFSNYPANAVFHPNKTASPAKLPNAPKTNVPIKLVSFYGRKTGNRSIFDRTVRSYLLSPETDSVKSFVRVTETLSVFNHYAFHVLDDGFVRRQYVFPETVFQLNHYRNSCDPLLIDGCQNFLESVVFDDSLEKFRKRDVGKTYYESRTGKSNNETSKSVSR